MSVLFCKYKSLVSYRNIFFCNKKDRSVIRTAMLAAVFGIAAGVQTPALALGTGTFSQVPVQRQNGGPMQVMRIALVDGSDLSMDFLLKNGQFLVDHQIPIMTIGITPDGLRQKSDSLDPEAKAKIDEYMKFAGPMPNNYQAETLAAFESIGVPALPAVIDRTVIWQSDRPNSASAKSLSDQDWQRLREQRSSILSGMKRHRDLIQEAETAEGAAGEADAADNGKPAVSEDVKQADAAHVDAENSNAAESDEEKFARLKQVQYGTAKADVQKHDSAGTGTDAAHNEDSAPSSKQ